MSARRAEHFVAFGFEQVHDISQPNGQEYGGLLQNFFGQRITRRISFAHHFTGDAIRMASRQFQDCRSTTVPGNFFYFLLFYIVTFFYFFYYTLFFLSVAFVMRL
jgi:hypothetical protein